MSRCLTGPNDLGEWRLIDKGVTTLLAGSDTPLTGTTRLTRATDEVVFLQVFPRYAAGVAWTWNCSGGYVNVDAEGVMIQSYFYHAPGDADGEFRPYCENRTGNNVDVEWVVWGMVPP